MAENSQKLEIFKFVVVETRNADFKAPLNQEEIPEIIPLLPLKVSVILNHKFSSSHCITNFGLVSMVTVKN